MITHLYVHIPFCPKVCPYCSFYKEASDRNKTQAFLDAVLTEAERHGRLEGLETIFFGGGTPTALSTSQLEYLITGLRQKLGFGDVPEFTLEMNPATVSLEKARALRNLGVNRVSMGVQSWDAGLLKTLGRVHSAEQAERSYHILREAGFENINLDFIFGIPGQTPGQWAATMEKTISLKTDHISCYCLTYEEDTEYFRRLGRGEYRVDEHFDADMFELTMDRLEASGFEQYEISNYARPGRECRHNLGYWLGEDYLGLGPSAFSTAGLRRWKNVSDTSAYIAKIQAGETAEDFEEILSETTKTAERLAFSLRTNRGVETDQLRPDAVAEMSSLGLLRADGGRSYLTRQGKMVADTVAESVF